MASIEDELTDMFEDRSAFLDRPLEVAKVHARVRRTRLRRVGTAATMTTAAAAIVAAAISTGSEPGQRPAVARGDTVSSTAATTPTSSGNLATVGFTVELASDGTVTLTHGELFDTQKLIARLNSLGITAVPLRKDCPAPDGQLSYKAAGAAWGYLHTPPPAGQPVTSWSKFRVMPKRMKPGYTLIVGAASGKTTSGPGGPTNGGGWSEAVFAGIRLNPGAHTPACLPFNS